VRRTVYREVPPRVEYCLTNTGRTLIPILKDMCAWGAQYERDFGGEEGGEAKAAKESPQRGEAVVCSMRN
jgi:DNA-binding HxlR family transcriptional regulator